MSCAMWTWHSEQITLDRHRGHSTCLHSSCLCLSHTHLCVSVPAPMWHASIPTRERQQGYVPHAYLPRANRASPVWLGELRSPARCDSKLHKRARYGKGGDTPSGSNITHARMHRCGYAGREPDQRRRQTHHLPLPLPSRCDTCNHTRPHARYPRPAYEPNAEYAIIKHTLGVQTFHAGVNSRVGHSLQQPHASKLHSQTDIQTR